MRHNTHAWVGDPGTARRERQNQTDACDGVRAAPACFTDQGAGEFRVVSPERLFYPPSTWLQTPETTKSSGQAPETTKRLSGAWTQRVNFLPLSRSSSHPYWFILVHTGSYWYIPCFHLLCLNMMGQGGVEMEEDPHEERDTKPRDADMLLDQGGAAPRESPLHWSSL